MLNNLYIGIEYIGKYYLMVSLHIFYEYNMQMQVIIWTEC